MMLVLPSGTGPGIRPNSVRQATKDLIDFFLTLIDLLSLLTDIATA